MNQEIEIKHPEVLIVLKATYELLVGKKCHTIGVS
jgi:hypothetical protein